MQVISVYVVVKRVVPDPEKASMLWPLEALTITEHTGLTRKVTFLSLLPSQPELCFQIPFISFSLTGRDRRAALKRSLQNWCPAAFCTFTAFILGGMVLPGSSGDRVDPGANSPGCGRAEGCEQVTKQLRLVCSCCVLGLSPFFPITASQRGMHALGHHAMVMQPFSLTHITDPSLFLLKARKKNTKKGSKNRIESIM